MSITIRDLAASDEARWRELWKGYCEFYEKTLPGDVTDATWARLLDANEPDMFSMVALDGEGQVVGMVNCVLHPVTWGINPICYLEDLFVDPATRKLGAGGSMIEAVKKRARAEGWHRVYWKTKNHNDTARSLYDKVADGTDWITYEISL
ncbi:MAG: GNAT family N-acetyltransferase [Proteobacteria bacterium]|nr:GNAT family N-acetyltransferase [Pseudomonadota bacterium]